LHSNEDGKFAGQPNRATDQNAVLDVLEVVENVAREMAAKGDSQGNGLMDELEQAIKALRRVLPG